MTEALIVRPDRADLLVERARYYRLDGQLSEALADLERVRELDVVYRDAHLERGLTLSLLQRDKEAEDELSRFLETGAASFVARAERARLRQRTGRGELALGDFDAALRLKADVEVYYERGLLQESLGKLDKAAEGYQEALSLLGDAVIIRAALIRVQTERGNYDAALYLVDEMLEKESSVKTGWLLRSAEIHSAAGDEDRARQDRGRALVEANRALAKRASALNLFSRAEVYVALGLFPEAKQDLSLALQKAPRFSKAREYLGRIEDRGTAVRKSEP